MSTRYEQLHDFIATARWFGGKGRDFAVVGVDDHPLGERLRLSFVELAFDDGGGATYQLPLSLHRGPRDDLAHALIGSWEDPLLGEVTAYDALHDHEATPLLLQAFAAEATEGAVSFHTVEGAPIDVDARSAVLSAEQSNTSVAFGETALLKVFRKVTPGRNPDIDIHAKLTEAGNTDIAALYGWISLDGDSGTTHLALLQEFLRTASDGWELALTSARDLLATPDIPAAEAGGDFAGEAHRLGSAVAEIHLALAESFPSESLDAGAVGEQMRARLLEAVATAPVLEAYADALGERFDRLTGPLAVQRIHGDLHLGQTLRTVDGWKIVDFEGEPAKPLEERLLPDSPWRDVAGMLRSFDYAAAVVDSGAPDTPTPDIGSHSASRAQGWADRNRSAFLDGYREVTGLDARTGDVADLVAAYEADKAVYEVVYETRNRPAWTHIPMGAIARIVGAA